MDPIVIIGSGLAGYGTARGLRRTDATVPLVIVSADGGEFYSKPNLSEAFAAGKTPATLVNSTAAQMAGQLNATVRPSSRVTAVDPAAKRVHLDGEAIAYSKLVLAVGAEQIRPPLAGDAAGAVMTVNSLDDYARLREALAGAKRVAIIGAGLIGCEFANDLAGAGFQVDVIDVAGQLLPRLLPPAGAARLQDRLAALGVTWHLGTSVASISGAPGNLALTLANGTQLTADVVLSAVGLRPNTSLARAAGLAVRNGVVANRHLETSAPDVYALGDCAEVEGHWLPFIMPITHAARALAVTLAGQRTPLAYPGMPVLVKTPACPTIVAPPAPGASGVWQVTQDADGVKSLYVDGSGRLLGFALHGKATAERAKLAAQLPALLA